MITVFLIIIPFYYTCFLLYFLRMKELLKICCFLLDFSHLFEFNIYSIEVCVTFSNLNTTLPTGD